MQVKSVKAEHVTRFVLCTDADADFLSTWGIPSNVSLLYFKADLTNLVVSCSYQSNLVTATS